MSDELTQLQARVAELEGESRHWMQRAKALEPAQFRVSIGVHHAEIQVPPHAPEAYHQGMIQTAIAEVLRRAERKHPGAPRQWWCENCSTFRPAREANEDLICADCSMVIASWRPTGEADTKPLVNPADVDLVDRFLDPATPVPDTEACLKIIAAWSRIRQALQP